MSYVTLQGLIDRFGEAEILQVTDREGAGVVDQSVAQRALDDADAEIDSYLGARYTLPLATVPGVLTGAAADIARYRLYDDVAPETVESRYKQRIAWLRDVAAGRADLGVEEIDQSAPASAFGERSLAYGAEFESRYTLGR